LGLGAVRLEEKDNKFLLKSNSLKPQVSSLINGNGDKSPYSRLFSSSPHFREGRLCEPTVHDRLAWIIHEGNVCIFKSRL
jgi:hypothetical protein